MVSGLTLFDRPASGALRRSLDLIEESREAPPEREAEIQRTLSEMKAAGELGVERVFLGSSNRDAELTLKDSKGRVRIRLLVDREDAVRIEILDEEGRTTARLP